jgi:hypothetical protein
MSGARVLWVDDDALGTLAPIANELERCGCLIEKAIDFYTATECLRRRADREEAYSSLLLDVVLPRRQDAAGLSRYLGVGLALTAMQHWNMRRIAFLTVISWSQLKPQIEKLKQQQTGDLINPAKLLELQTFVKSDCTTRKSGQ